MIFRINIIVLYVSFFIALQTTSFLFIIIIKS